MTDQRFAAIVQLFSPFVAPRTVSSIVGRDFIMIAHSCLHHHHRSILPSLTYSSFITDFEGMRFPGDFPLSKLGIRRQNIIVKVTS